MLKRTESSSLICPKTTLAGPGFMAQWTQALWAVLNIPLSSKVNTPLCVQISSAWLPLSQFTHNISLLPHPNLLPLFFSFFSSVHVAYLTSVEFFNSSEEAVARLTEKHSIINPGDIVSLMAQYPSATLPENSYATILSLHFFFLNKSF